MPDFRGKWRLARIVDAAVGPSMAQAPGGVLIQVILASEMDHALLRGKALDEDILASALAAIQPGDTVIDVGANVGYVSFLAARRAGEAGRVWAFEPSYREFRRLVSGIEANAATTVIPVNAALSDEEGSAMLGVARSHTGVNRLVPRAGDALPRGIAQLPPVRVPVLRGDALFREGTGRIGLVKVDVEGAELRVLRGLRDTLERRRPSALLVEITEPYLKEFGASREELYRFLEERGYAPAGKESGWQYDELFLPVEG